MMGAGGGGGVDGDVHVFVVNANAEISHRRHSETGSASNPLEKNMYTFQTPCPQCHHDGETTVCTLDIPHFKQVIIWSLVCAHCGFKSREVKSGGAISEYGTKLKLRICTENDLKRDVVKSDTAGVAIPELDFELEQGGLDGVYTTVEGLLKKLHNALDTANPFGSDDGESEGIKALEIESDEQLVSSPTSKGRYARFLFKLKDCAEGKAFPFTLIISDPLSNSFIRPCDNDDDHVDSGRLDVQEYERSHDENEMLGLNDIQTDHYRETRMEGG